MANTEWHLEDEEADTFLSGPAKHVTRRLTRRHPLRSLVFNSQSRQMQLDLQRCKILLAKFCINFHEFEKIRAKCWINFHEFVISAIYPLEKE